MPRITLSLLEEEREALLKWARRERRELRDQAALIIRQELERRGLLCSGMGTPQSEKEVQLHCADR